MKRLKSKNIFYIVTGAEKAELAEVFIKEMVSEGANVFTILTKAALDFVDLDSLKKIQGNIVKLDWADNIKLPKEDAVLIAPCTFNTFNSIAAGLANNYPLCLVASALGGKTPIFIAPAMNKGLWDHPIIKENINKLETWGCRVIWPEIKNDKVTMIDQGKILDSLYFYFKRVNYKAQKRDDHNLLNDLIKYRNKYLDVFRQVGLFLSENNLNLPTAGCLSVKVPHGFLITSSGSDLSDLDKKNLSLVLSWDENSGKIEYIGDYLPSSETPLHCVVHEKQPENFVLHFHCPELTYQDKLSEYVTDGYVRYGCFQTGKSVLDKLNNHKFCIMQYHGEVVIGDGINEIVNIINSFKNI